MMDQYSIREHHQRRMDTVTDRVYKAAGLIVASLLGFGFTLLSADSETKADIWFAGLALLIAAGVPVVCLFWAGHKACEQIQRDYEAEHLEQLDKAPTIWLTRIFPRRRAETTR